MLNADNIVEILGLTSHPEGGFYRENYRSSDIFKPVRDNGSSTGAERNLATSIFFLLKGKQVSAFHRLKSDEIWYYHMGSPLKIYFIDKKGELSIHCMGVDILNDQKLQLIIPKETIFAAEIIDKESYTLLGCLVTPGFCFDDFELTKRDYLLEKYPQHSDIILRLTNN